MPEHCPHCGDPIRSIRVEPADVDGPSDASDVNGNGNGDGESNPNAVEEVGG